MVTALNFGSGKRAGRGRRLALLMGTALCLAPLSAFAQATTLEEALVQAYETNPTLLAQRAQVRAVDETVNQAIAGWKPTVTADASVSRVNAENDRLVPAGQFGNPVAFSIVSDTNDDTISGGVTLQQNIFTGLRTFNQVKQSKADVRAAREQLRRVEGQVLFDAVTAYMDVLRDEAVVRLSKNNVQVLTRQLEAAQDRFRVGEITRTDVAQAEARLSGAQSNLIASEAQLTVSRASFERVIGINPGDLTPPPALPELPNDENIALNRALQSNPDLQTARETEAASRYAIKVARALLLPTVTFQGRYSISDTDGDFFQTDPPTTEVGGVEIPNQREITANRTDQLSATINVTVPLYQGGSAYSQLRQAKQVNSEDKLQIAEAQRILEEQIATSWDALRSARATILASREQVRANEIAFEGVSQEAQVGSRTTLDVLDAEQELLDSRVTLVTAERDEYVAAFQLLSTVGYLSAERLRLPTEIYFPEENYKEVKNKWIGIGQKDDFR